MILTALVQYPVTVVRYSVFVYNDIALVPAVGTLFLLQSRHTVDTKSVTK